MSMCCIVFGNRHLATIGEWQASIDALGFALSLDGAAEEPVAELQGHLPAVWEQTEAGFECMPGATEATQELVDINADFDFGGPWTCSMEVYYMGFASSAGAMIAGAAYAHATGGILWEAQGGDILNSEAAIAFARQTEIEMTQCIAEFTA